MRSNRVSWLGIGVAILAAGASEVAVAQPADDRADANEPTAEADAIPQRIRLRRLQNRVQSLKMRAWELNARSKQLTAELLDRGIGARVEILHRNRMSDTFRLTKLVFTLDAKELSSQHGADLADTKLLRLHDGPLTPGSHTISVYAVFRGNSRVFKYFDKYTFTVRSSHTFHVEEGKTTKVEVIAHERGITTPTEQKPTIDFKISAGE